jgi:hypothetical protein
MNSPPNLPPPVPGEPTGAAALVRLIDRVLAVLVGVGVFLVLAVVIIDRLRVMPPGLKRYANVKNFLDAQRARPGGVYLLGSSVTLEGLDAERVERARGAGPTVYNLAWTEGGYRQWPLIHPRLLRTQPSRVVMVRDWPALTHPVEILPERLRVTAMVSLVEPSDRADVESLLLPGEREVLGENFFTRTFLLHRFPIGTVDAHFREAARRDLRYAGHTTNFRAPWVQTHAVSPSALEANIRAFVEDMAKHDLREERAAFESLGAQLRWLRARGAPVVVFRSPSHPEFARRRGIAALERSRALLRETCAHEGVTLVDQSELLTAEEFADAVHPVAAGRDRWSDALGRELANLPSTASR